MRTTLFGRQVTYEEMGKGRPLLLIHAYPLNRTMWEPQLHGLADIARVIAPDLWGFGDSEPMTETTVGTYADELYQLAEAVGATEAAVVCGLSMGGYVAFEYFRRHPQQVAGVILGDTRAGPDSAEGKAGRDQSAKLAKEKGAAAIAEAMLPKLLSPKTYSANSELVQQVNRMMQSASVVGIVAALAAMRDRPDSRPTLAEIKQPALVIGGADDQLFPQSEFRAMVDRLPAARLEILPEAGHLSNLEQPDAFNRAVRLFLRKFG
jgi:pimeloyl-ACP methyl ester carboxylesterase